MKNSIPKPILKYMNARYSFWKPSELLTSEGYYFVMYTTPMSGYPGGALRLLVATPDAEVMTDLILEVRS